MHGVLGENTVRGHMRQAQRCARKAAFLLRNTSQGSSQWVRAGRPGGRRPAQLPTALCNCCAARHPEVEQRGEETCSGAARLQVAGAGRDVQEQGRVALVARHARRVVAPAHRQHGARAPPDVVLRAPHNTRDQPLFGGRKGARASSARRLLRARRSYARETQMWCTKGLLTRACTPTELTVAVRHGQS